jgi:2-C-methyl-D-erythritol 4-phosphate cytidylyltransferase
MIKNTAIVLAGGSGSRMNSDIPKQYIEVNGKPLLAYSLIIMDKSPVIDEIILVARENDIEFCRKEIVTKYNIKKVAQIVKGGSERYWSVLEGLKAASGECVWIHDGARPCLSEELLYRLNSYLNNYKATIAAVPSKDTVKIIEDGVVKETPDRNNVWMVQTPQAFEITSIISAYEKAIQSGRNDITDDSMVMESFGEYNVHFVMGEYDNIKLTTPEDMVYGMAILQGKSSVEKNN